jgi:hypothetical protein
MWAAGADVLGGINGYENSDGKLAEEDQYVEVIGEFGVDIDAGHAGDDAHSIGECAEGSSHAVEGEGVCSISGVGVIGAVGSAGCVVQLVSVIDILPRVWVIKGLQPKWIAWMAMTSSIITSAIFLSINNFYISFIITLR